MSADGELHRTLQRQLRQDAGEQAAFRVGQEVRRGLAVEHQRRVDLLQFGIGAQPGKLRRPIPPRQHITQTLPLDELADQEGRPRRLRLRSRLSHLLLRRLRRPR